MATRLATKFNVRNNIFDSITPPPWVQDNIVVPQGEWKPANWLPVVFLKTNRDAGEDAFVISSGKVVALDAEGRIVPAGLRGKFAVTGATVVLTYTADDAAWGVTDLTTGQRYTTDGTTTYTALVVAKALVERGLVPEDVVATNPPASDPDIVAVINAFISTPVGVALYDMYVYSGRPEDGDQYYTNYSKQHLVQFTTEKQMKMPHRVASSTTSDVFDVSAVVATAAASAAGDFPQPGEIWTIAGLDDLARYDLAGTETVTAFALANKPVAKNTTRTPISCDVAGLLLKEKSSIVAITKVGDWFLDADVGLLFVHSTSYATLVSANTDPTFSYSYYNDAGIGAASEQWIYFDGEGKPGDLVSVDSQSNFVRKGTSEDILASTDPALGRLLFALREPHALMDKVKSAYNLSGMSASGKMPGSATAGYSDMITLAAEDVADRIAVITVRI